MHTIVVFESYLETLRKFENLIFWTLERYVFFQIKNSKILRFKEFVRESEGILSISAIFTSTFFDYFYCLFILEYNLQYDWKLMKHLGYLSFPACTHFNVHTTSIQRYGRCRRRNNVVCVQANSCLVCLCLCLLFSIFPYIF